ncbi:MAG: hypothetical protein ACYDH9_26885 [Limisphaerales bacterium]
MGSRHYLGLNVDGRLWAWGENDLGQLGDGTKTSRARPIPVGLGVDWAAIGAVEETSVALADDGTVWTWGAHLEKASLITPGQTSPWLRPTLAGFFGDWARYFGLRVTWGEPPTLFSPTPRCILQFVQPPTNRPVIRVVPVTH